MKFDIRDAVIEVTRRCNMECEHCLRGDAEDMDISDEYLREFFSRVSSIGTLTITGGEPSLAVDRIRAIMGMADEFNVEIGAFYMATNAKSVPSEFLSAIIELYAMCVDQDMCCLNYSSDQFHERVSTQNIGKLMAFRFCEPKGDIEHEYALSEGRAEYWGTGRHPDCERYTFEDGCEITEGIVYLNCEGNIISGCDFSYESQRDSENIVCSVLDMSWDAFLAFEGLYDASNNNEEEAA